MDGWMGGGNEMGVLPSFTTHRVLFVFAVAVLCLWFGLVGCVGGFYGVWTVRRSVHTNNQQPTTNNKRQGYEIDSTRPA